MNVSTSSPSSAAAGETRTRARADGAGSTSARDGRAGVRNEARNEAFERSLREKASRLESGDQGSDEEGGDEPIADGFAGLAMPRPEAPRLPPVTSASVAGAVELNAGGTRAAIEAALQAAAPIDPLTGVGESAQAWQVTLNEPGLALEVSALRQERTPLETRAAWSLNISSAGLPADAMARHASQLADRLRMRGVDATHVRVEGDGQQQGDGQGGRRGQR